ncbi:MAG TPA: hypothetical protein VJ813_18765 [Vicinamibacterales bacterium]|nr:hypothetical protein [Vicinamibacterales bacterium]
MKKGTSNLDLDENRDFQQKEWHFQRAGWCVLMAFVVAAALGLFGSGPLSHARTAEPGAPLWVEYDRFVRLGKTSRLVIHVTAPAGRLQLRMNRTFFEVNRIQHVTPEPSAMEIGAADVDLRFDTQAGGPFTVILDVEPLRGGRLPASITTSGGATATFRQFAYF